MAIFGGMMEKYVSSQEKKLFEAAFSREGDNDMSRYNLFMQSLITIPTPVSEWNGMGILSIATTTSHW